MITKIILSSPSSPHILHTMKINEKPSTKAHKLVPFLRRASLNIGALVRQKSFDLTEEEEAVCQEADVSKRDICMARDLAKDLARNLTGDLARDTIREARESDGESTEKRKDSNKRASHRTDSKKVSRKAFVASQQRASSDERSELVESRNKRMINEMDVKTIEETNETTSRQNDQKNCEWLQVISFQF